MQIRPAKIEDTEAVLRLYHFLSSDYQDNSEAFQEALKHPAVEVFILKEGEEVAGTAAISFRVVPSFGLVGYIDDVVVDPNYRGKGYGKALSLHCLKVATEKKCKRVELTSRPSRVEANQLYQSLGFEKRETNVYRLDL